MAAYRGTGVKRREEDDWTGCWRVMGVRREIRVCGEAACAGAVAGAVFGAAAGDKQGMEQFLLGKIDGKHAIVHSGMCCSSVRCVWRRFAHVSKSFALENCKPAKISF